MEQQPVLLDPAGADLAGEAALLREIGPAALVELPGGIRAWSVTGNAVLKELLTDDRVSKDPRQHWPAWINGEYQQTWVANWIGVTNMLSAYGEDHRRLRKLVAPAFTKRRTDALGPRIEEIATELLDRLERGGPEGELRGGYAHPLPMQVICELFGLPEHQQADTARLIEAIMDTTATPEQAMATYMEVHGLLAALVAAKRETPGDDLTSVLIAARDDEDGSGLSEAELIDTLLLVIGAGHETTVNLIGNAVHALLTHPDQLADVLAGKISWNDVIEETLRWAPSIANLPLRFAVDDIELPGGVTIAKGDAILASFFAASRDPELHGPTAEEFDARRGDFEHLAFGFGVHYCIGSPLARLEASIALPALFARFPELTLAVPADELRPTEGFIGHGVRALPVRLTAG
ncbi:cytochrome P450 [Streptomyces sp. NBC_01537]|uniref:cytochrome P450 family protein n=1 Tax=Streptomyces sp. NBC_01537 TaxID=2903896 RepID=UPI0038673ADB